MVNEHLAQANAWLKLSRCRCRIECISGRLYLVATLPPRPWGRSLKTKPHQQKIALGLDATIEGIRTAEGEARKVAALLASGTFTWDLYPPRSCNGLYLLPNKGQLPIQSWVERFEADYFMRRRRDPKSETTWKIDYYNVFRKLPSDQPLTAEVLKEAIASTTPDTRTRRRYCLALGALARFAGLDFDVKPWIGTWSPFRVSPREIPDDELIVRSYNGITHPEWRWVYGMIATYGLRPHEVFALDLQHLSTNGTAVVLAGKTGERCIWPLHPEWVQRFDLPLVALPKVTGNTNSDLGARVTRAFRRLEIPFCAYNLRHAWAIRALHFGWDNSLAARQMGHSVIVHTATYQRWITQQQQQQEFERLLQRPDRPLPPVA